ncbi:MAG: hypothetical protein CMJ19_01400 [Phycisphaeraceae bacterium]|nr:hypothetical protein [Phycisphaeraceae bacterium]
MRGLNDMVIDLSPWQNATRFFMDPKRDARVRTHPQSNDQTEHEHMKKDMTASMCYFNRKILYTA